jgi:hypothetical protein
MQLLESKLKNYSKFGFLIQFCTVLQKIEFQMLKKLKLNEKCGTEKVFSWLNWTRIQIF